MFLYLILEKTFWRFSHEILSMFGISIYNRYDAKNRITNWLNVSFSFLSFFGSFSDFFWNWVEKLLFFVKFTKELHSFFDKIFMTDIFNTIFIIWNLYCILSKYYSRIPSYGFKMVDDGGWYLWYHIFSWTEIYRRKFLGEFRWCSLFRANQYF